MYEKHLQVIEEKRNDFFAISDGLWDFPETSFEEYRAAELIIEYLKSEGFEVTVGLAGIPTAFKATYGKGKPSLGILAEYDGLSGMSQLAGAAEKSPIEKKDKNHSCGHNLFAGGSVAAAIATKSFIDEKGGGTVTLFGCPGEEGGAGKVYMARDGIFNDIDAVVSWHPESMYMVRTRPALASLKVDYEFEGIASHAGAAPDKGRSALDAVELMNVGVNFLREHMPLTARVHYAITDAGGDAPNIVQSHAKVYYMIRDVDSKKLAKLKRRVDLIADGAALMTETTVIKKVRTSYANLITIPTLQKLADEAMRDVALPIPTEDDIKFAEELRKTMMLTEEEKKAPLYADTVLTPAPPVAHGGSTDTADVSWNTPTVQMHIGTWVKGTPGHSWQSEAQGKSPYAKRAMLYAGKAVAGTLMRLFDNPKIIEAARAEHKERVGEGYVCGLPEGALPDIKTL